MHMSTSNMYMPHLQVSSCLRTTSYVFLVMSLLGFILRITGILLYRFPPHLKSNPGDFVLYLFVYGLTVGIFGIVGIVFEALTLLTGFLGIAKDSIATLVISLCCLFIATVLHVVNSIWMFAWFAPWLPTGLIVTNIGIFVLQIVVIICLISMVLQIKRVSFNRLQEHIRRNQQQQQQTVYVLPTTTAIPFNVSVPRPQSPTPMNQQMYQNVIHQSSSPLQEVVSQQLEFNHELRSHFTEQHESNPSYNPQVDDFFESAEEYPDLPPKYSEQ